MESMVMAKQKQDEYIKQLASKVDVLTTHNKILEAQIVQQASFHLYPGIDFLASSNLTFISIVIVSP